MFRARVRIRPVAAPAIVVIASRSASLTRDRMKAVLPEADVADYRPLVADLELRILTIGMYSQPPSPGKPP